ncbi:MAG: molybdopterin-dependent oxidoreductase [Halobacteriaceae archaeon]
MARPLAPDPSVVDWGLLVGVALAVATGLLGLLTGVPEDRWVFVVHGVVGLSLTVVLGAKVRRVAPRLRRPRTWDRSTAAALVALAVVLATLATGALWVSGVSVGVARWNGLMVHAVLGTALVVPVLVHLAARFRLPPREAVTDRRVALQYAAVASVGGAAYLAQQRLVAALGGAGAARRFTGSREVASLAGNAFPRTEWAADDPDQVAPADWSLSVTGEVARPLDIDYEELVPEADDAAGAERRALLDCTSGWYSVQDWRGVRVGDLLDAVGARERGRYVRFVSVTGYRWSLPVADARDALLATHVGDERLSHGHGFPLRLVAPGRRGFQWVKWVDRVEVRADPDYGQWVAIFTSGLD